MLVTFNNDGMRLGHQMYRLDESCLKKDKLYLFAVQQDKEVLCIMHYLKYITFSKSPEKMEIGEYAFKGIHLTMAAIPKEYKVACENIAKLYELTCGHTSRGMLNLSGSNGLVLSESEKILVFSRQRSCYVLIPSALNEKKEREHIKQVGEFLDRPWNTID